MVAVKPFAIPVEQFQAKWTYGAEQVAEGTMPRPVRDARGVREIVAQMRARVEELRDVNITVHHRYSKSYFRRTSMCRRRAYITGLVQYEIGVDKRMRSVWTISHEVAHVLQMERMARTVEGKQNLLAGKVGHGADFRRAHLDVLEAWDPDMAARLRMCYTAANLEL